MSSQNEKQSQFYPNRKFIMQIPMSVVTCSVMSKHIMSKCFNIGQLWTWYRRYDLLNTRNSSVKLSHFIIHKKFIALLQVCSSLVSQLPISDKYMLQVKTLQKFSCETLVEKMEDYHATFRSSHYPQIKNFNQNFSRKSHVQNLFSFGAIGSWRRTSLVANLQHCHWEN